MTTSGAKTVPSDCHPERSEGSVALGSEMLRGVYAERSACAQHDSALTHTDSWINLLNCIIGPLHCGMRIYPARRPDVSRTHRRWSDARNYMLYLYQDPSLDSWKEPKNR